MGNAASRIQQGFSSRYVHVPQRTQRGLLTGNRDWKEHQMTVVRGRMFLCLRWPPVGA